MDKLLKDLRFAARSLTRSPAYTAVVVLTLGLAIGANSAIFSLVNGVLLRPLPYEGAERIVQVVERVERGPRAAEEAPIASQPLFLAWRDQDSVFEHLAMYSNQSATLRDLEEPVRLEGLAASPALFPLLGVEAQVGRTFTPDEELPGNDGVVLLGHRAWQRYFGGSEDVLGRQLRLDETSRTVIGIMPPGFAFPTPDIDCWVPLVAQPIAEAEDPDETVRRGQMGVAVRRSPEAGGGGGAGAVGGGGRGGGAAAGAQMQRSFEMWGRMVGRLQPGMSLERAAEEGTALARGLRQGQGPLAERRVELVVLQDLVVGPVRTSLLVLMGAVGFVLLIACANVANLVLARAGERRRETAVRSALGAGRWEILRWLVSESLILALAGGALALLLAWWGLRLVAAVGPEFIPRLDEVAIDLEALGFTFLVALLTGVLFGLVPARRALGLDLSGVLKQESAAGLTMAFGHGAARKLLVVAELALAVVLLVGAGLLVSSFVRLVSVDPGYDADNLLLVQVDLPESRYPDAVAQAGFYDRFLAALEGLEGVAGVALASRSPSSPANLQIAIGMQSAGGETPDREPQPVGVRLVGADYFDVLRIRPLRGRVFDDSDRATTQPVVVLSESGARNLFGEADPLGTRMRFMGTGDVEIVGIVADVRQAGVDPTPQPDIYLPAAQVPERMGPMLLRGGQILVRTESDPLRVVSAISGRLRQVDPEVMALSVSAMRDRLAESLAQPRFYATVVAAFALLALVLAAVGIYGLLAYTVQQRARETAIRKALGARAGQVLGAVMGQGLALTLVGLAIGIVASLGLTRVLASMLYEVEPTDPSTLALVSALFLLVSTLAILLPARRALRTDPMQVLRYE